MKLKRTMAAVLILAMLTVVPAAASRRTDALIEVAIQQIGTPYALKSNAPNSFNCFTFVAYCLNQVEPGTVATDGIHTKYKKITSIKDLEPGDVICFSTTSRQKGVFKYHYGIYGGRGCFVHASNEDGAVTVGKLRDYKKRFVGAVRVF